MLIQTGRSRDILPNNHAIQRGTKSSFFLPGTVSGYRDFAYWAVIGKTSKTDRYSSFADLILAFEIQFSGWERKQPGGRYFISPENRNLYSYFADRHIYCVKRWTRWKEVIENRKREETDRS